MSVQNFEFHLENSQFLYGRIEDINGAFYISSSHITAIETPLPKVALFNIPVQSLPSAIFAFEELIKHVVNNTKKDNLRLVRDVDPCAHIDVQEQKNILNKCYTPREIPVQPHV
ncbi:MULTISPECIES: hypothetical protein [Rahnella]|uniref:Uncharacterized protein n=1 Tax=Rahnella laticis TaxID=2787622 RepID=A0ABS0EAK3_9GAMM|nr:MULTISPECIES: hypothetical protein [Rahnella]MBF7982119.1 hypothetical protein [Rahnella laticis]MBF8002209.1 hypothetical protein [Rahnella sp. LAC-M12]